MSSNKIKCCLFDAFGTLVKPREPVHLQYAKLGREYGLIVDDLELKRGFKQAYKEVAEKHPTYGHVSNPPLSPDTWWALVIERAFDLSGVAGSDLQTTLPILIPRLLKQFSSRLGYSAPPDVIACLRELKTSRPDMKLGVITNSDPRIVSVLTSLEIIPDYISEDSVITSWAVKESKPNPLIFREAADRLTFKPEECVHIGDDVNEDYFGAKEAGFQAVLLKRREDVEEHSMTQPLNKEKSNDTNIETISSLQELPDWISNKNRQL